VSAIVPLEALAQFDKGCQAAIEPCGLLPEVITLRPDGVSAELLRERLLGQLIPFPMELGELFDDSSKESALLLLKGGEVSILLFQPTLTLTGDVALFTVQALSLSEAAEVVSSLGEQRGVLDETSPPILNPTHPFRDRLLQPSKH